MVTQPTIVELYTSVKADLESEFGSPIPTFGKNFLNIVATVKAAKLWLYYKAIGFVQKNIFVDKADPESAGGTLERFGRVKLNRNPFPAVAGQYTVQVTGTNGSTINAKTTFKSNDDSVSPGKLFILDTAFALVGTTGTILLRALESGVDSRLAISDGLTATVPLNNINQLVTVTVETVEPKASEDIEEYREKTIEAYRLTPQGGSPSDFRLWADVQGVEQTYPYARSGDSAEVNLYVEATLDDSVDGKGTPSQALLDAVKSAIEDATIDGPAPLPLGVFEVHYLPITPLEVIIEIEDFENLTTDKEDLIEQAIIELLATIRPFVPGIDVLADKNDILNVNKIVAKIFNTIPNAQFGDVNLQVNGTPVSSWTFNDGYIPTLDQIVYS